MFKLNQGWWAPRGITYWSELSKALCRNLHYCAGAAYPPLPDASLELVEDEHVELRRIDLTVSIGGAEIGEGARLAE